jgi:GNAT superfamily N-acetyltransferase
VTHDRSLQPDLTLRPIREEDRGFLRQVYASTRAEEMTLLNWTESEKADFLQMQFEAQDRYYHDQFREARYDIIELDAHPIGRLYVDRRTEAIRIIDIALLPEHRNRGFGSRLLKDLMAVASQTGQPVNIHVELNNPAISLYLRLGFVAIEDHGLYRLMEWKPA